MKKAKTQKNTWSAVACRFFFARCPRFGTVPKKLTGTAPLEQLHKTLTTDNTQQRQTR